MRRTLAILGLAAALLPPAAGAASRCLGCHPSHYASRGGCAGCHRGDERTDRKNIAHRDLIPAAYASFALPGSPAVARGTARMEALSCRRCHTWLGEGNGLATNLDDLPAVSTPRAIHDGILSPAAYMPDFRLEEATIRDVVTAVLAGGARLGKKERAEIPVVVHFEDGGGGDQAFQRSCGGCHKALSDTFGGLGTGAIGPNLSGLFTRYYPGTFGGHGRWTPARLKEWLGNPRSIMPAALMPPVPLDPGQAEILVGILSHHGPPDTGR